jgi:hypothetical protein
VPGFGIVVSTYRERRPECLARQLLDIELRIALRRLTLELRRLSKDANLAALPPLKKKDAHRPRFSVQNPPYHVLVHSLYRGIVEEAHGEFAVRKSSITGELQGAAPAVLKLLQPFLPEIIPAKLSYSTLRRMLLAAPAVSLELHRA